MDDQELEPVTVVETSIEEPDASFEIGRLRRRQWFLVVLLLLVAVAGPVAGAAIERRTASDDGPIEARTGSAVDEDEAAADAEHRADEGTSVAATPAPPPVGEAAFGYGYPGGPDLEWLGSASIEGVEVRLLFADYGPQDDGNPFWNPPPGCFASGSYSVEVSSARFAAVFGMERFERPDQPDATVQLIGVAEGDPRWVAVAAVDPVGATVTFPDGQVATPVDVGGLATATAPAPSWADVPQGDMGFTATVTHSGGTHEVSSWYHPTEEFYRENCEPPPPSLPEPGEQPANPASATTEIEDVLTTVFGNPDVEAKQAVVEHPDVLVPAMEALAENYPDISATAVMGDLVFTAPDHAYFLYDLNTNLSDFPDQVGEARLIDERWVMTTESLCTQLRKGGASCEVPEG